MHDERSWSPPSGPALEFCSGPILVQDFELSTITLILRTRYILEPAKTRTVGSEMPNVFVTLKEDMENHTYNYFVKRGVVSC